MPGVSLRFDDETPGTCPRCRRFIEANERCESCEEEAHDPHDPEPENAPDVPRAPRLDRRTSHKYEPTGEPCGCKCCRYGGEEARQ